MVVWLNVIACRSARYLAGLLVLMLVGIGLSRCTVDLPASDITPVPANPSGPVSSTCSCTTATPVSTTTGSPVSATPVSTTMPASVTTVAPAIDTLATVPPRFSPAGGNLYVGTTVRILADSVPVQGVVEFSVDAGDHWQVGQQFPLMDGGQLLTRIRVGNRVSRSRGANFSVYFNRVLIIGNSIMNHAPDASIGWFNTNGMAASAPEKDFVHLLTQRLKVLQPSVGVRLMSGGDFERSYTQLNLNDWDSNLQFAPDLIIIRIGENVSEDGVEKQNFEQYFRAMLAKVVSFSSPVKVVCSTSFWNQPRTDAVIRRVATEKGYPIADLCNLVERSEYQATQYKNVGVARHPNDAGMQQIADLIWNQIQ